MKYLLYLWRSFTRSPRRHLTLYIILTCAFLLPLAISIYRDSSAYGDKQYWLSSSKGAAYHIGNASEEYVPFFEDIPGLSQPFYENGTIYLTILSENEWRAEEESSYYALQLFEKMDMIEEMYEIEDEKLTIKAWHYEQAHGISTDPFVAEQQKVLLMFNIFIILISVFVIQSAYKSHLNRFSQDIGTLVSCGACKGQIRRIFVAEFILVFSLASLSALLISVGILKLLFSLFLETRTEGLAWLIFHIDPVNTILHLLIYFAVSAVTLGLTLWRNSRKSAWTLLHHDSAVSSESRILKRCRREIRICQSPASSLSGIWRKRTNGCYLNCLLLFVPVMTIFLFLFNYLILDIAVATEPPEYELLFGNLNGFSEEEMEIVENIDGVMQIVPRLEIISYESDQGIIELEQEYDPIINDLEIYLERPELHSQVAEILKEKFPGDEYTISNLQVSVDFAEQTGSKGVYLLLAYLFCMLFLFVLIILYAKLCDYIESCRGIIRSLYVLGASRKDLHGSCIKQSLPAAVAAAVAPLVVSEILFLPVARSLGRSPVVSVGVIAVYVVIAALSVGVFLHPVHHTMKRILKEF